MSDASQGDGWWLASDGKWYAPHQHASVPPPPYQPPPAPRRMSDRKRVALALGVVVVVLIVAAIASSSGKKPTRQSASTSSTTTTIPAYEKWGKVPHNLYVFADVGTDIDGAGSAAQSAYKNHEIPTGCQKLALDAAAGSELPPIPYPALEAQWSTILTESQRIATDCVDGVTHLNTVDILDMGKVQPTADAAWEELDRVILGIDPPPA